MSTPVRNWLTIRFFILDLPVAGFLAGVLFATGVNFFKLREQQQPAVAPQSVCDSLNPVASRFRLDFLPLPLSCTRFSQFAVHPSSAISTGLAFLEEAHTYRHPRYPAVEAPPFQQQEDETSPRLAQIVAGILDLLEIQGYPTEAVSISLIDLSETCCQYAGYQDWQPRYPASIVKMFWLVALYGQYEAGLLQPDEDVFISDEELMAHYSNNGASSRILDAITQTQSGESLPPPDLAQWIANRNTVNTYFHRANYPDLNIAHKTFPIPDLAMEERIGRDLQFAEADDQPPIHQAGNTRNYLTTLATARLLYEIETGTAVSKFYSDRAKALLRHSTDPTIWQGEYPNAIEGFFGEYLPPNAQLYTKLGFTFDDGRQEAAIIASPDGSTRFILVVFANDAVFSSGDNKALSDIARYVYDQMQTRNVRAQQ